MRIEKHYRKQNNKYEKYISCDSLEETREIYQYLVDFFDRAAIETTKILADKSSDEPLPYLAVQRNKVVSRENKFQACFDLVELKSKMALPVRLQLFLDFSENKVILFVDVAHQLFASYDPLMEEFISKVSASLPEILASKK